MKIVKLLLTIVVCAGIMLLATNVVLDLTVGLNAYVRHALPPSLGSYTSIVWISYLVPVIGISIVSFASGAICRVNPKTIRLAAITFVIADWVMGIYWQIFVSLQIPGTFSFVTMAILSFFSTITLVTVFAFSKWLCSKGIKLRERTRKRPPCAELTQDQG